MSAATPASRRSGLRTASWWLGGASLALPAMLFAYQSYQFERWAEQQDGGVCGMPLLGAMLFSVMLAVALSALGALTAWLDYRRLPAPRQKRRLIECLLVGAAAEAALIGGVIALVAGVRA